MKKFTLLALALLAVVNNSDGATVGWGSQLTNSLGLANGNLALQGSSVSIGYFAAIGFPLTPVSDAQIQSWAAAGDKTSLLASFQPFGSSVVGNNYGTDGVWDVSTVNGNTAFAGKQIYMWTLDAANLTAATQWGIYTNPTAPEWKFPSDSPVPGTTNIDLGQAPKDATGLIVGSFGGGPDANFNAGLYQMASIAAVPVPEPSAVIFGAFSMMVALSVRRRRQTA